MSNDLGISTVKAFCPRCGDAYHPRGYASRTLDGAYFGTSFPHLFLLVKPSYKPLAPEKAYEPRIYGFRIHDALPEATGVDTPDPNDVPDEVRRGYVKDAKPLSWRREDTAAIEDTPMADGTPVSSNADDASGRPAPDDNTNSAKKIKS